MKSLGNIIFIAALLAMVSAASCSHKEIECPDSMRRIHVLFEWDHSENADVAGMTLYFYPLDEGGSIWRFDIAGRDGGTVEIPLGQYCLIACNNDLPGTTLQEVNSPSTIQAVPNIRIAPDVYGSSGMLYDAVVRNLEVTPCGVRYVTKTGVVKECGHDLVRCHPDSLATQYTVILRNVSGLDNVRSANAILKGTRNGIYLESQCPSDLPAALSMKMEQDRINAVLSARGCMFSTLNAEEAQYRLTLQVVRSDGKGMTRDIAINSENLNCITPHNVIISIAGIEIPEDSSPADITGIDVGVDGWDEINIDLEPSFENI